MAQLKDTIVSGSLRATDSLLATKGYLNNSLTITNQDAIPHLIFSRNYSYISIPSGGCLGIMSGTTAATAYSSLVVNVTTGSSGITGGSVYPGATNIVNLGLITRKWLNTYTSNIYLGKIGFVNTSTESTTENAAIAYDTNSSCLGFRIGAAANAATTMKLSATEFYHATDKTGTLGTSSYNWKNVYSERYNSPALVGTGTTGSDAGSSNASTRYRPAIWTFNANITPTEGDIVTIKQPCQTHDYGTWITLDGGSTYYPLVLNSTSRPSSMFDNNVKITMRFDSTGTASVFARGGAASRSTATGVWRIFNSFNTNDNTYDRTLSASGSKTAETAANGGVGIHRYSLEMLTINNKWSSISTQSTTGTDANTDNTAKTKATCAFLLNSPILYQNNNTGAIPGNSCSPDGYTTIPCNLRQCAASSTGWANLTVSLPVYLIGQVQADKKSFKLKNIENQPWWTQTLPATNDGYIYIYLGVAYNATNIYLHTWHPIYWHDGQNLQLYQGEASYGATLPATGREGQVFYQLSDPWYELPSGGNLGEVLMKHSGADRDVYWGMPVGGYRPDNTVKYYVAGSILATQNANAGVFNTNVYVENNVLFGAAWNDYAEYRQCLLPPEPGRCIVENGDGTLSLSSKRLQPGAEIVSDTFGFAIGQNKKCNTPIAVSGRVLAYMDVPRDQIKIGAPVCSGPNGTVSQMTEQEARDYPWLIIGTVSQIPVEAEWGENKVRVNGRVWIRVR